MSVLDNVKAGLHNHDKYNLFTSIVHTPKYFKVEKTMNEEAMKLLKVFRSGQRGRYPCIQPSLW